MDARMIVFAQELCALLEKHKMSSFNGKIVPGIDFKNNQKIDYHAYQFNWSAGRHEEDVRDISISYEEIVKIRIPYEKTKG